MVLFKPDRADGFLSTRETLALMLGIVIAGGFLALTLEGRPMLLLPWEDGYFEM